AEKFSQDFARWFLGDPIPLTRLSPTELSLQPIRADALILLESEEFVLHLEFQSEPDPDIFFRMLDYRVRVYRRFPHKQMRQVVIYLKPSGSELVRQNTFVIPGTRHEFEVVRLWEVPTEQLLGSPGLLPLAALSQTDNRVETLREVARRIERLEERTLKSDVAASTAIIAGLVLEKEIIQRLLREEIMRESVIYQDIRADGEIYLILRQLNRRIGGVSQILEEQIRRLPVEQLENLGEALLDFESESDLSNWLERLHY
ncbi:MAG: Rpn family recombination-promoting nuclease/putative transposase, partial [Microcystaceae cyanobacterium]